MLEYRSPRWKLGYANAQNELKNRKAHDVCRDFREHVPNPLDDYDRGYETAVKEKCAEEIDFITHIRRQPNGVVIEERFVPCKNGETPTAFFGMYPNFIPMKLANRTIEDA